jgi:hypothetical protein
MVKSRIACFLIVFCLIFASFSVFAAELPEWTKGIKIGPNGEVTLFGLNTQASLCYFPRSGEWPTAYTYEFVSAYDRFLYARAGATTNDMFQTDARLCILAGIDLFKIDNMLDKYCGMKTFGEPIKAVENVWATIFKAELKINFLVTYDQIKGCYAGVNGDIIDLIPKK